MPLSAQLSAAIDESMCVIAALETRSVYYVLCEHPRQPYGLYLNVAPAGNLAPPHCHGVWCVAAGFRGEEKNRFYQRVPGGSAPDSARLRETGQAVVRVGTGMCMMPDDIHSVEVSRDGSAAHVHLYGRPLSCFPNLVLYDLDGGTCRSAPPPTPAELA